MTSGCNSVTIQANSDHPLATIQVDKIDRSILYIHIPPYHSTDYFPCHIPTDGIDPLQFSHPIFQDLCSAELLEAFSLAVVTLPRAGRALDVAQVA